MHLVLVINSLGVGGAERVLIRLANHWSNLGHKISFITFFNEEKFSYQLATNNNINLINLGEDNLSKKRTGAIKYLIRVINRIYLLRQQFKLLQPDVIVSFLVGANISVLLANIGLNIPVVVSERADPFTHNISIFYKKLRFLVYKYATVITVQNQLIAKYFLEKFENKIFIIPNFVKPPKTQKNTEQSEMMAIKKIISVGRLDDQKDHKTLICAFAKLADLYPDLTLTIYGDGELRNFLQDLIIDLKLTHRVFLSGVTMDIEAQLLNSDLFVFPSVAEGFSNALCEAMSCGLPVIAADCAGNVNIIQNGIDGLLFKCGDIPELSISIEKLLNNSDYCNKLATNAKNIVNKFSEKEILKQWDNIVEFARLS